MNTLAKVCKQIVTDAIDHDYLMECDAVLCDAFMSGYGKRHGKTPRACRDYLQALPSVCTVPFWNGEILEILEKHGIDVPQDAESQSDMIDAYWLECGKQFWLLIR